MYYYNPNNIYDALLRKNTLQEILKSWEKTPFRHYCGVKQVGVDCTHLVALVFHEVGLIKKIRPPKYFKCDYFLHNDDDMLLRSVKQHLNVESVDMGTPIVGDIAFYSYGKSKYAHSAIFSDEEHVYQSVYGMGVQRLHWKHRLWFPRLTEIYRIVEE